MVEKILEFRVDAGVRERSADIVVRSVALGKPVISLGTINASNLDQSNLFRGERDDLLVQSTRAQSTSRKDFAQP